MTRAAIIQSSYLPWRGYFDIIRSVDVFVFFDDVEYSKGSWRNRNKIKSPQGPKWLSIPLPQKGLNKSLIHEVQITDSTWQQQHLARIDNYYRSAPYRDSCDPLLTAIYSERKWNSLSELNQFATQTLAVELGITETQFVDSREFSVSGANEDRVIAILQELNATEYVSGPSAASYMTPEKWRAAGIEVIWMEYDYPQYPQLYPPFAPDVSVLDLLLNVGPDSSDYIWGSAQTRASGSCST